ncbi:uncharacterized protein DFL_008464 [Arthrobotrys flagrans]|uniref:UDP-N-acetylmuramate dehydrogenase n=1 Tax=Arthrobotrys flagrans TaxID=97331 RepID=A0A436ZNU4_ARTFL|nr:hypothetical protein DFL_008464 [Arthrobotrys flagrans]
MKILESINLESHSTMRLGGRAAYLTEVADREQLKEAITWAKQHRLPVIMIGQGSNIIWKDSGFNGLVICNRISHYQEEPTGDNTDNTMLIKVGAGENWDKVVERTVSEGLSGIESLSLIPGTAGATPVQNVGAYGQEIRDTLVSVEAYDNETGEFVVIKQEDCGFGYRTSRFKTVDRGRFYITAITLQLRRGNPIHPFYPTLQNYLVDHDIVNFTPHTIRDAVIAIRQAKLPNPMLVPNCGSFFANPVIEESEYTRLQVTHPNLPNWPVGDGKVKIPAAWLIEEAGLKDFHDTEMGVATWANQPLVLINRGAKTSRQLLTFRDRIIHVVRLRFGVLLEQEPELLP